MIFLFLVACYNRSIKGANIMNVKLRILSLRLIEKLNNCSKVANEIGIDWRISKNELEQNSKKCNKEKI